MDFQESMELVGQVIDAAGVAAIVIGAVAATIMAGRGLLRREPGVYKEFRRFLGRSILLGLELLVAADIIKTVAVTPTLNDVAVLAAIVVIRTFLSWSLELEISGRWPWQKEEAPEGESTKKPGKATENAPEKESGTTPGGTPDRASETA